MLHEALFAACGCRKFVFIIAHLTKGLQNERLAYTKNCTGADDDKTTYRIRAQGRCFDSYAL